ncbi:MAG: PKD domain-containing protein [bacterium]|nr:PKD domain-containing protein [bacterium]
MKKLIVFFIFILIVIGCNNTSENSNPLAPQNTDAPIASFSINGTMVTPATLTLTNTSLNADSYLWNFGDGRTSNIHSPTVTYTTMGQYTITLTAIQTSTNRSNIANRSVFIEPGSVYLSRFTIHQIPFTDNQGSGWDLTTGPDVFCELVTNNTLIASTQPIFDIVQSQLPLIWDFSTPYFISNRSQLYSLNIFDYDDFSSHDFIGSVNFAINNIGNNYPANVLLQNGQVRVTLTLIWR